MRHLKSWKKDSHGKNELWKYRSIKSSRFFDKGAEGELHEVEFELPNRESNMMVEKRFMFGKDRLRPHFRNPRLQFKTISELLQLNEKKNLGLHIVKPVYLRERHWLGRLFLKPTIVMKKLELIPAKKNAFA